MKRILLAVIFVLAFASFASFSQESGQSSWDKYVPRTLQSIVAAHQESLAELENDPTTPGPIKNIRVFTSDSFPFRVCLVFLGKTRPLQGKRAELVDFWKRTLNRSDELVSKFGTEMLFREGDKEFWIAVQKPLVDPLPKEVGVGKQFTAYVIWMGAIKSEDHWEWVFAMNEFDTPAHAVPSQKDGR